MRVTGFRANRLLNAGIEPVSWLSQRGIPCQSVDWLPGAGWVEREYRENLLGSELFRDHRIYVQNLASMLPVPIMGPEQGETILDLAAAPGSKTIQIAESVGDTGEIAAVELVRGRYFSLRTNLAEHGASFVRTFLRDGGTVWRHRPEYFDRVLLDAPCASEGRFQTSEPESFAYWSPGKTKEMVRKQKRLLYSAIQSVRPGGVVVYSTCSLSAEENEGVVSWILKRFGDRIRTEEFSLPLEEAIPPMVQWKKREYHPGVKHARRILPSARMEGFFLCRIRKQESTL